MCAEDDVVRAGELKKEGEHSPRARVTRGWEGVGVGKRGGLGGEGMDREKAREVGGWSTIESDMRTVKVRPPPLALEKKPPHQKSAALTVSRGMAF